VEELQPIRGINSRDSAVSTKEPEKKGAEQFAQGPKVFTSRELFGESRQVSIAHNGETYSLRITANQKLILTK